MNIPKFIIREIKSFNTKSLIFEFSYLKKALYSSELEFTYFLKF